MNSNRYVILLLILIPAIGSAQSANNRTYAVSEVKAKKMVAGVLKQSPVIDGHNDLLRYYYDCKSCPRELDKYPLDTITKGHTDIVRWKKGGLGCQLLNVFGNTLTARNLLDPYDLVYRMTEKYSNDLLFATSVADIRKANKEKKIAIVPTMEFSVRLENSLTLVRIFHKLGLRAVTLAYQTNDIADGSDDKPKHNGLSELGKKMVMEMNRTGIMVDISHVSEKTMYDVLDFSMAPVIFSHSNARKLCNVNRNVSDSVLKRLKDNKGIIMISFVPYFTTQAFADWFKSGDDYWDELMKKYKTRSALMDMEMDQWEKENPQPLVSVADVADHFDYVKNLIGADYIGIGSDFDGIDYLVKGLEDVSTYPALLIELARRGWTEVELKKVSGENFLRVFGEVEKVAAQLKKTSVPGL